MQFAKDTSVSVEKTKGEIERTVMKYGGTAFGSLWQGERVAILFEMKSRRLRFILPMPNKQDAKFRYTEARRRPRSDPEIFKVWEQACRQRWRALLLAIRAKLEAVECGISTFDSEFLANVVMPDGHTIG